jgi:thymidylate synthase
MNKVDEQYLSLLQDIIENGVEKDTRSGKVRSVFGRQLRFDLKDGFPILTTKKVFTKGVIHELLWFLQRPRNSHGSMNIEYLIRNGVHIWDDDAYRWFKNQIVKDFNGRINDIVVCTVDDEINNFSSKVPYEYWIERDAKIHDPNWLPNITKEEFLDLTAQKVELRGSWMSRYRFGDLGPIYGKQWRSFGESGKDQIAEIIDKLKTNPNDRRMLCIAYNPDVLYAMALPPCHVMFQFYTRELSQKERINLYKKTYKKEIVNTEEFESANIPKYGLSCMWTQRSVDVPLGLVWNIVSYGLLTHIIAKLVNMIPDELIGSLGDCHIYLNQLDGVKEQLNRKGYDELPNLIIDGEQKYIEDFKFEDFKIMGYKCDPIIKMPLSVG